LKTLLALTKPEKDPSIQNFKTIAVFSTKFMAEAELQNGHLRFHNQLESETDI